MALNRVEISGGLTRDPDFKFTPGGYPLWKCTVAVNGAKYDPAEKKQVVTTSFILLNGAGYVAEMLAELGFQKGDEIWLVGELEQREWTNSETGKQEHRTQVNIVSFTAVRLRGSTPRKAPAENPAVDPWSMPPPGEPGRTWDAPTDEPPF